MLLWALTGFLAAPSWAWAPHQDHDKPWSSSACPGLPENPWLPCALSCEFVSTLVFLIVPYWSSQVSAFPHFLWYNRVLPEFLSSPWYYFRHAGCCNHESCWEYSSISGKQFAVVGPTEPHEIMETWEQFLCSLMSSASLVYNFHGVTR